ncbi:MAG: hypothetical protein HKN76_00795 [Saprospiraceae bacterium]|nr:hypothetical protein [Saprospiraceae bacterium]
MRISLIILILANVWFGSCAQRSKSRTSKASIDTEVGDSTKDDYNKKSLSSGVDTHVYTDTLYPPATGKGITIQNSLPKGGMIEPNGTQYADSSGKRYAFAIFWTRIINETTTPLELDVNFPADSFAIFSPADSYLKLFLPADTLTWDKLSRFNYGITGLKPFLDRNFNKATRLQRTIKPNEEHIFYIATLAYQASGTPRAALFLQEQDLYYRMSVAPYGNGAIPCGKIVF